jgi:hypothetical protein
MPIIQEDDFIVAALTTMVKEIEMRSLRLRPLREIDPLDPEMSKLIDRTAVQLTAYMRGREAGKAAPTEGE